MIPRRILLVIGSLGPGGAERVLATMANYWAEAGHQVSLLTYSPCVADHYALDHRVERIPLDLLRDSHGVWDRLYNFASRTLRLRRAVRTVAPQVVVSFIEQNNVMILAALFGTGIPVIVSERTDPRHHPVARYWHRLRRWLYPFADIVVVQTEAVRRWVTTFVPTHKVRVIPNMVRPLVSIVRAPHSFTDGNIVIAAGRLTPEKGFDLLLDAFAEAHRGQLAWRLVILGEGPERTMLEAKIRALGLEGYTLLPGVVSPIEDWLQHADLFALSSRYEGFPNVLLEAMTCGLPVLAFDCASGPGEIIQSDVDGLLVPAGDVSALAAGLERLMHDTALRQRLGQAAKVSTQRYGLPQVMANWDALIDKAHLRGGDENGRNR